MGPVLTAQGLVAGYDGVPVVHELDLVVEPGAVVAVFGPNGAGKSTLMRTLAGALPPVAGTLRVEGRPAIATGAPLPAPDLTVRQHLRAGRAPVPRAVAVFEELEPVLGRFVGSLDPDEHRLVVVARALARSPRLVLVDEVTAGASPPAIGRMLDALRRAADAGTGVVLVEQFANRALAIADHVVVLRRGRAEFSGSALEARQRITTIETAYFHG